MAALVVPVSSCKPALERLKASTGDTRPDMSERPQTTIALVKGTVVLLRALFLSGFSVRNCNWANQQNSDDALQAAHYAFHILVHLCWAVEHTTEYVRTRWVSFLFWGRWDQTIPGKCHSEEMGEALLARLVEKLRLNPNISSLDDCFDLFLLTLAARTDLKDCHGSHLQNDTIKLVRLNLSSFVRQISDGKLVSPVLWKSKVKTVKVMDERPGFPRFPISLYHDMSIDHLQDPLQRTLQTLVKPVSISQDCMDALQQDTPHRLLAQQASHNTACDTILRQRQPQRYVGRNVSMPQAVRPERSARGCTCTRPCPPSLLLHTTLMTFQMSL